jgi:hypothetical protein
MGRASRLKHNKTNLLKSIENYFGGGYSKPGSWCMNLLISKGVKLETLLSNLQNDTYHEFLRNSYKKQDLLDNYKFDTNSDKNLNDYAYSIIADQDILLLLNKKDNIFLENNNLFKFLSSTKVSIKTDFNELLSQYCEPSKTFGIPLSSEQYVTYSFKEPLEAKYMSGFIHFKDETEKTSLEYTVRTDKDEGSSYLYLRFVDSILPNKHFILISGLSSEAIILSLKLVSQSTNGQHYLKWLQLFLNLFLYISYDKNNLKDGIISKKELNIHDFIKKNKTLIIKSSELSETYHSYINNIHNIGGKSPHWRSAHFRVLKDEKYKRYSDGSYKIIFIKQQFINSSDKIKTVIDNKEDKDYLLNETNKSDSFFII